VHAPDHELVLVRHGDTVWSGTGRFTGHLDVPLSPRGRGQAAAVAACLTERTPHAVLCSDLSRASDTARAIASAHGACAVADTRLREEHLGYWQGLTREDVAIKYPAGYARWLTGDVGTFDGREGLAATADRAVTAILEAMPADHAPAGPLIVVTHCNTAMGIMGRLLQVPAANWPQISSLRPAHWAVLSRSTLSRSTLPGTATTWRLLAHDRPPGRQDTHQDNRRPDQSA
jgi:glucosyl-3-phosphoglycerate phosphatase